MAHSSTGPGAIRVRDGEIEINAGRDQRVLRVTNTADRPVQVGSHFHLAEANAGLEFDREAARGCHLDIAAGTAIRFEPGVSRDVPVVPFGGRRHVPGLQLGTPRSGEDA